MELAVIAVSEHDEMLGCGSLGYRLADETQAALVTVDELSGTVNLVSPMVIDESWIGLHQIAFEVYLIDLDPNAEV